MGLVALERLTISRQFQATEWPRADDHSPLEGRQGAVEGGAEASRVSISPGKRTA